MQDRNGIGSGWEGKGNMNCERFEPLMIAYMDGRATDAERVEVDRHLLACAACRTRVEEFGRTWNALDEAPTPRVFSAFDARLRARIAAEPQRTWFSWLPAPRLAFSAALLVVLAVWVGSRPEVALQDTALNVVIAEEQVRAVKGEQVLEDLDVLANFEALAELPPAKPSKL
ncbi:MAG: zf-HC2 domain-containing protein [Acidobacteria bacterium]|nr:zf-HC2 domain-containing protein [Acidobacteriota bacterium]